MAGTQAIRDVGDTLVAILRAAVDPAIVDPANVRLAMPRDFEDLDRATELAITLFLYRLAVNGEMRNTLGRMPSDGRLTRPSLPLELEFLITPWARDAGQALLIAGMVARAFYDRSELSPSHLEGGTWETGDSVQLVLKSLPIEDHYRIWDSAGLPYRLSLTYQARVIGIDPTDAEAVGRVAEAEFRIGRRQ